MPIHADQFFAGFTLLTLLGVLGGIVRWVWTQWQQTSEQRAAVLTRREREFEAKQDARVDKLEATIRALEGRIDDLAETIARQRTAIELLMWEVARLDPNSPVLGRVERILKADRLVSGAVPPELEALARKLDEPKTDL
ncbi:hypothetical protein EYB45_08530 [Erythrobacteraceae bacterium CFH 75059]|uniref:hypothetical protein n=1 Tax=Qipengyuania thermophila TaxID=2509361 RepID=UPI00101ED2CA|nr:hypothetical protein [Qipengyuania thermophila]TCD04282.1 hypothetical protein EYB45_08530 [Erythrobacteraceae bacterium CFH 75059]